MPLRNSHDDEQQSEPTSTTRSLSMWAATVGWCSALKSTALPLADTSHRGHSAATGSMRSVSSGLHPGPVREAATVPARMDDEEIDELILSRLRQRRAQQAGDRTASAADLATFFNEPEPRIQNRLRALAD
jgi:hypothetical protein